MTELSDNKSLSGIKVYTEFDSFLIKSWKDLYNKGANYNLSYEWCNLWFKYFNKKKELYIITYWENGALKMLAPFYKKKNTVSLIGTKPDLYDEFGILYESEKYISKLLTYIQESKLQIIFKHINMETIFAKYLVKWLSGVKYISHVTETKPCIIGDFKPSRKLKDDIKRCQNNAKKTYNQDLLFCFNIEREATSINEFISLHKKRWNGGFLEKKANVDKFLEDLFFNTDLIKMSRLYLVNENKTVAYHLGYQDSNKIFWSSMPSYNTDFKKISPGKVLLFKIISEFYENTTTSDDSNEIIGNNKTARFDFGRGSEGYKSWFANKDEILFNVITYNSKYYFKIKNPIEKILKLIFG